MSADRPRYPLVRIVAAILAVIAIVALAAMALRTSTKKVAYVSPLGLTAAPPQLVAPSTALPQPHGGPLISALPATPSAAPASVSGGSPAPVVITSPIASPSSTLVPAAGTACPFPLPAPGQTGGLASLVGIVPVFGPFSAEAFAFSPAYEPLLTLFGPFLPAFEQGLATADPLTAPVIAALRQLEDAGYGVVGPLYGPYRQQILDAETQFATAVGVYTQTLADSAPAACLIDLEGLVAPKAQAEVASQTSRARPLAAASNVLRKPFAGVAKR